jgi:uncharacterized membrane-anchored protein
MRRHLLLVGLALITAGFGWAVMQKEHVLSEGTVVFLELAPRDPRSLMQGDYMVLAYRLVRDVNEAMAVQEKSGEEKSKMTGRMVLELDERQIATFARIDDGVAALAPGQVRMRFKSRTSDIQIGAESFFFQEGTAETFNAAKYGELRVDPDGVSVLVGLRDESLRVLGGEQRLH